jgi:hypothetical protein
MEQWWDDVSDGADRISSEQLARIVKVSLHPLSPLPARCFCVW